MSALKSKAWTDSDLARLGCLPDAELAARFHRTEEAVSVKRGKLRIPAVGRLTNPTKP